MTKQETRDLFFEIHSKLNYEAPGDPDSTAQAFRMLSLPDSPRILDVGCGPGAQTIVLARTSKGAITAVDKHAPYLDILRKNADKFDLSRFISVVQADMNEMPFEDESFDLIWSEGAAYIIGFERALCEWKRLLRPKGCMALTELCWLQKNPPGEIAQFWGEEYPGMKSVSENLLSVEKCGCRLIDHFVLPERAWRNYYVPLEKRIQELLIKYADSDDKTAFLSGQKREIEMRKQFAEWYGYVFFLAG